MARALGISPQAISQWPDVLSGAQSDRVTGAAFRLGRCLSGEAAGESEMEAPEDQEAPRDGSESDELFAGSGVDQEAA